MYNLSGEINFNGRVVIKVYLLFFPNCTSPFTVGIVTDDTADAQDSSNAAASLSRGKITFNSKNSDLPNKRACVK